MGESFCRRFGRAVGPEENPAAHVAKLRHELPRFRQVIEQATTVNRVEMAKAREINLLKICMDEFDIFGLEKVLHDSRAFDVRAATFNPEDALNPGSLRQSDGVTALKRSELENVAGFWERFPKQVESPVVRRVERSAVIVTVDSKSRDPRTVGGKGLGDGRVGHVRR